MKSHSKLKRKQWHFTNAYLKNHSDTRKITDLIPKNVEPVALLNDATSFSVIYRIKTEEVRFDYSIDTSSADTSYLADMIIMIVQQRSQLPVWTQATEFLDHDAYLGALERPLKRTELFYDGTTLAIYYEYTMDNDDIKPHKTLTHDETLRVQIDDVLGLEEGSTPLNMPLSLQIKKRLLRLKETSRNKT